MIRHCGDHMQADLLEAWLGEVTTIYRNRILSLTERESQVWGCLRVPPTRKFSGQANRCDSTDT